MFEIMERLPLITNVAKYPLSDRCGSHGIVVENARLLSIIFEFIRTSEQRRKGARHGKHRHLTLQSHATRVPSRECEKEPSNDFLHDTFPQQQSTPEYNDDGSLFARHTHTERQRSSWLNFLDLVNQLLSFTTISSQEKRASLQHIIHRTQGFELAFRCFFA